MRTIGGWVITGQLGQGAGGAVLRVRDPRSGAEAALKLAAGGRPLSEHEQRRFGREVEALQRLDHPGLARLLAAGTEHGRAFLVTPLIAGEPLSEQLRRGPLYPGEAVRIARAVAAALAHAHERGVLHRDLKPDNVLLTPAGNPVLIDFGLAMDLDLARSRLTQTGTFLGTPGWWPPEQALGEHARLGPASDVYGVGALLYAMLTGRPPVLAESLAQALEAASRDVAPPSVHRPGLDRRLDRLVARCLARRPEERFPTAAALVAALDEVAGALTAAPRVTRRRTSATSERAGPAVKLAAALSAIAVAAAGGFVVVRRSSAPAPAVPPQGEVAAVATAAAPAPLEAPPDVASPARPPAPTESRPPVVAPPEKEPLSFDDLEGLDRRVAADPDDVDALAARAFALATGDRIDEAEAVAERVLARSDTKPGHRAMAHYARARARARRLELAGALADFDVFVAAGVPYPPARLERGSLHLRMGNLPGALEDLTVALLEGLTRTRDEVTALIARGVAHEQLGDVFAAIEDLTSAVKVRGVSKEDRAIAFSCLRRLKIPDVDPAVAEARGHLSAGRRSDALAALDRRLAEEGDDFDALLLRGRTRHEDGEHAAALVDLERALTLRPTRAEAALLVGKLRLAAGDLAGAERPLRNAVAGLVRDRRAWEELAAWAEASGRAAQAQQYRARAARLPSER